MKAPQSWLWARMKNLKNMLARILSYFGSSSLLLKFKLPYWRASIRKSWKICALFLITGELLIFRRVFHTGCAVVSLLLKEMRIMALHLHLPPQQLPFYIILLLFYLYRNCTEVEFEHAAPTAVSDRVCKSLTQCEPGHFESRPATRTTDRTCSPAKSCWGYEYEVSAPTPLTDRQCEVVKCCSTHRIIIPLYLYRKRLF